MRRSSLFQTLCLMLVLSFGLAHGQSSINITAVSPAYGGDGPDANTLPDTIKTGGSGTVFTFNYVNGSGGNMTAATNGFVVYSPDGANWSSPVTIDSVTIPGGWGAVWDLVPVTADMSGSNGSNPDTVGIGGVSLSAPHIPNGFNLNVGKITVPPIADVHSGKMLCIDSARYSVAQNEWLWSTDGGGVAPAWTAYCFRIFLVPNEPPIITNCPSGGALILNHCSPATYDFNSSDPDALGARPLTFVKNSGPGVVNAASGVWTYSPTLADVAASPISLSVSSQDDPGNLGAACVVALTFTNIAPSFTAGCNVTTPVGKGNTATIDMNAISGDCDPISFSILGVAPAPVGGYSINSSTGVITFNTAVADGGTTFVFTVQVSDGNASASCVTSFEVLNVEPYEVQIEKTHNTIQGTHEQVCVTLNLGSEEMTGFDFLIAYDNSALSLAGVIEGDLYADCGWEYFTFRYGANGNCSNACPTGLVRVVGLAETNNGPNHPEDWATCATLPLELFCLDFLVTNDRTFECQYVPVRFFWVDCGDNTIAYNPSDDPTGFVQNLAVSRDIFEFDSFAGNIANGNTGFPTYYGAQDVCLDGGGPGKPTPIRFLDLINGGVDIVCADSIDDRGDINLNGLSHEIADAVLFSNYFVYGMGVFTINAAGQIAATDVNADGLVLSVADLVYLIRVVIGDASPYNKLAPVAVKYTQNSDGVMSIQNNVQIGGAFVVVAGEVTPRLIANNMEMLSNFDGANTRILVWSSEGNSFTGDFLNANGHIVSIDMATFEGQPVALEVLPTEFALNQNYPNPFNPKTRISFALPTASDYTLTIYNVTGQKVTEYTGSNEAGNVEIDVDAANYSSGVYFYKLIADNGRFTETKKMVLVK